MSVTPASRAQIAEYKALEARFAAMDPAELRRKMEVAFATPAAMQP